MSVAILLDHFGSGGVERVACLLANGFVERGVAVEMVVAADRGPVRDTLDPRVKVRAIGKDVGSRGARLLRAVPALARYLKEARPRVLLSPGNHTHVAAALAHRRARVEGVALVAKVTNPLLKKPYRPVRRLFYRWAFARADRVLVLSRNGVEGMAAIDPRLVARTRFVHNPYVSAAMLAGGAAPEPAKEPPLILSVGRLSVQKNQAMLLDALARLRERPWRLVILGEGPEEARLRAQAEALGVAERVEFAGFQDPVPFYRRAALLALPSRWEDLPATMIEALACGCPVVATASSEAVVNFLGELGIEPVPVNDVAAFATALEWALDNKPQFPPTGIAAYGIAAGVEEHLEALRPFL